MGSGTLRLAQGNYSKSRKTWRNTGTGRGFSGSGTLHPGVGVGQIGSDRRVTAGYGSIRRVVAGQSSISVSVSLRCVETRRSNLLIRSQRHDGAAGAGIVNIVKVTVFPMSCIVHLAEVSIGTLVVKLFFSHAAFDEENGRYDDH